MQERHYAPRTVAYRVEAGEMKWPVAGLSEAVVLLTHDPGIALPAPHETMVLPAGCRGDTRGALYDSLRAADERKAAAIFVLMPARRDGLWAAIADRLTRATQPWRGGAGGIL